MKTESQNNTVPAGSTMDNSDKRAGWQINRVTTKCPSLKDVDGEHLQALGLAMQGGFWAQITSKPEVVDILNSETLSSAQGARLAEIAREFIATGKPQGQPWDGWNTLSGLKAVS